MDYKGSCLCGAVGLTINSGIERVICCHCKMCQKAHGSAFAVFGLVRYESVNVVGRHHLTEHKSSIGVTRTFCKHCGSNFSWSDSSSYNDGYFSFSLSLLDTKYSPSNVDHVYKLSEPNWEKCLRAL